MCPTPRQRLAAKSTPEKRSGNLLVDIQAKLRAGKGAGYARWATLFNLKQMAQTVAYLQENELLDYNTLAEKASAASARYHDISGRIKAAEKRMTEIAVMRTHIINYAKTRDTYIAYRKAGYSKKFLSEHESDITLHMLRILKSENHILSTRPSTENVDGLFSPYPSHQQKVMYGVQTENHQIPH